MLNLVLVQVFWFSFFLIGLAVVILCKNRIHKTDRFNLFFNFLEKVHFGVCALILWSIGVGIFIPFIVVGYIFESPVSYIAFIYILALLFSVCTLILNRKKIYEVLKQRVKFEKKWLINGAVVLFALGLNYVLSLHAGSSFESDTPLYLGKIQDMLSIHMSLSDPFAGYNGVLNLSYSANLLDAIQAMAAYVLHIPAYQVWHYSYAFYKLVLWASFFALANTFLPKKTPKEWSYIILTLVGYIYTGYFFSYPELPHFIVIAWFGLLLVGLKLLIKSGSGLLVILSAALIATTHSVSSLVAAIFLLIMFVVFLIARKNYPIRLQSLVISIAILLVPVVAVLSIPNHTGNYLNTYTRYEGLHGIGININKVGPVIVPKLKPNNTAQASPLIDLPFFGMAIILVPYVIFARRLKNIKLKLVALFAVVLAGLAVFNVEYISIVGYVYLIYEAKNKLVRTMLVLLVAFYFIIAYNPVVLTLAYKHIPFWTITRFQDLNALSYIAPIVGILVLYSLLTRFWDLAYLGRGYSILVLILIAAVLPVHKIPIDLKEIYTLNRSVAQTNEVGYQEVLSLRAFDPYITNKTIYTNDPNIIEYMVDTPHSGFVGLLSDSLASQSQNLQLRSNCQLSLFENLNLPSLEAAKIGAVILIPTNNDGTANAPNSVNYPVVRDEPYYMANRLSFLKFQKQVGADRLYTVLNKPTTINQESDCNIPYGQ